MKRFLIVALFVLTAFSFGAAPAFAAIAFDNASSGSAGSTVSSLTYSLTVGSGSNRILWVSVIINNTSSNIASVTYAGTAMTPTSNTPILANQHLYLYYEVAPTSGANNVVITLSGPNSTIFSNAASYTGASQTGVPDSVGSVHTTTTSGTVSTTVVAANSWMVAVFRNDQTGNGTAGAGTMQRTFSSGQISFDDSNGALTSGSHSLNETWGGANTNFYALAASFAPFVVPPTPAPPGATTTINGVQFIVQNSTLIFN